MSSFYQFTNQNVGLVLESESAEYVLTLRDLPLEEKPREKLLKYGPAVLNSVELLAVIINAGTKKEEVLSMSRRIMKEYGEKSLLSEIDAKRLSKELGIPLIKAIQIVACGELGRRFFQKSGHKATIIHTPKQVFDFTKDMRDLPKEHLRGLYLNAHYKIIHDEIISIGTIDANIIHPREVFKPALEYSAAGLILVHNHPSGISKPSSADLAITQQIAEAGKLLGIELIDHVIITRLGFLSILQGRARSLVRGVN